MRVPVRHSAAALVLAVMLAACGASPTPAPSTAAQGSNPASASATELTASVGPSGDAGLLQPGPADAALVAAAVDPNANPDPQALGAKAAALGAGLRKEVDAPSTYGQIAADEETALEQAETQALAALTDQLKSKAGQSSTPDAVLAGYRTPSSPDRVRPGQGLLAVSWSIILVDAVFNVGSYDPRHGEITEFTVIEPMNSTTAGGATSGQISMTFGSSNGVVRGRITIDGTISKTSPESGQAVTTTGSSSIDFAVNPCPDAGGGVSGTVDVKDGETTTSPGRMTLGWNISGHADFGAQVDDQAEIAKFTSNATWDEKLTRTATQGHESDLAATGTFVLGPSAPADASSVTWTNIDGTITQSQAHDTAAMMGLFTSTFPYILVTHSSTVWKGGKCFEVRPDPKQAEVDPNSQTTVNVTVYHWVDKADVQLPVKATLSGPKQIDPSGQPVTSPATFTYTAAGPGTTGTVTYKVVSRRGISEATGSYTVRGNLVVDLAGKLALNAGGVWEVKLTIAATGVTVTAKEDGTLTASGEVTLKGTATSPLAPCSGTITETTGVQVRGQLQGPPDAQVYHLQFGPTSTNSARTKISCPSITQLGKTGDYFGQWSTTLGYVDIPAAGGTVTASGSTSGLAAKQATGTFTAKTK